MASGEMYEIHGKKHKILGLTLLSFLLWVTITLNQPMSTFILPRKHPYYSLLEASPLHFHLPKPHVSCYSLPLTPMHFSFRALITKADKHLIVLLVIYRLFPTI